MHVRGVQQNDRCAVFAGAHIGLLSGSGEVQRTNGENNNADK
jgi:hypothetical protein